VVVAFSFFLSKRRMTESQRTIEKLRELTTAVHAEADQHILSAIWERMFRAAEKGCSAILLDSSIWVRRGDQIPKPIQITPGVVAELEKAGLQVRLHNEQYQISWMQ
jgi:hypothetical protein